MSHRVSHISPFKMNPTELSIKMHTRNAIEEWAKWQLICAAVFLVDGSIYAFKFPYAELSVVPLYIPGTLFPLGSVVGLLVAAFILAFETDFVPSPIVKYSAPRAVMYLIAAVLSAGTLTNMHPALELLFASGCLAYNSLTAQSQPVLPK
jgi:hypothetical protein